MNVCGTIKRETQKGRNIPQIPQQERASVRVYFMTSKNWKY